MYVVTKRFGRTESRLQEFRQESEAVSFIMEKLKEDKQFKVIATYGLYEGADLLREYTEADIPPDTTASKTDAEVAASGKSSTQSFRPTPFSTTPRLGPQTGLRDDSKDKDEK